MGVSGVGEACVLHLVCDSPIGGIQWFYPWSGDDYYILEQVSIPTTKTADVFKAFTTIYELILQHKIWSYVWHWTFGLEMLISKFALA